jgi:hypothetical protein
MTLTNLKISLGLGLVALLASLVVAVGAGARVLPEPGQGSPVTRQHPRQPAVKKATRRNLGGFPAQSGVHVKVPAEARTE